MAKGYKLSFETPSQEKKDERKFEDSWSKTAERSGSAATLSASAVEPMPIPTPSMFTKPQPPVAPIAAKGIQGFSFDAIPVPLTATKSSPTMTTAAKSPTLVGLLSGGFCFEIVIFCPMLQNCMISNAPKFPVH